MASLEAHPLFEIVSKEAILDLVANQGEFEFNPRTKIVRQGEPISNIQVIATGAVRIGYENQDGLEVIYCFKDRGTILGVFSYISEQADHIATVHAIESTKIYSYSRAHFFRCVSKHSCLEREVKRQIAFSFQELLEDRKLENAQTSIRLATLLTRMLDVQTRLRSRSIGIPLSKADLARRIGSKSETVVRILSDWERKKILQSKDKIIEVFDRRFLDSLIGK